MNVRVQGGTNAGWRKPLQPRPGSWSCRCNTLADDGTGEPVEPAAVVVVWKRNPGHLVNCPDCGERRP